MTPAERAAWSKGEEARRALDVHPRRPPERRNRTWEMDHKDLPVLVLPPRGPAQRPWLTTIIDDGTRVLLGWAIGLTVDEADGVPERKAIPRAGTPGKGGQRV
jgi:putative transposase